jgi:hypothetical protein
MVTAYVPGVLTQQVRCHQFMNLRFHRFGAPRRFAQTDQTLVGVDLAQQKIRATG